MLTILNTFFIRCWEKALFLLALLACLTLCSLATHYFTAAPEEQDESATSQLLFPSCRGRTVHSSASRFRK